MKVNIQKVKGNAIIPEQAYAGDAGFDLFAIENATVRPGEVVTVGTGLAFEIPEGYEMQIRPRSGAAMKYGLTVVNSPGTIDAGFRNEVKVILTKYPQNGLINFIKRVIKTGKAFEPPFEIKEGDKIAQAVIKPVKQVEFNEVTELSSSERGVKGFGSSGKKKVEIKAQEDDGYND